MCKNKLNSSSLNRIYVYQNMFTDCSVRLLICYIGWKPQYTAGGERFVEEKCIEKKNPPHIKQKQTTLFNQENINAFPGH